MAYIDCFLAPVPRANRAAYEALARVSWEVLKDHGALAVTECWLDESGPDAATYHGADARLASDAYATFIGASGAKQDETVVLSWVEWADKAARDAGMDKVTADPRMQFGDGPMVFDGARLVAGGFLPMLRRTAST
jgi:uncharacterized protein YbaA (DUF1428 family)